jgi:transcriptional regulator with XRE-family HTH domain
MVDDVSLATLEEPMPRFLTPAQCRAARGLLDWTQEELAEAAGVCRSTVRDFEKGRHDLSRSSADQVTAALEMAGIHLIPAGEMGPGVRLLTERREQKS